MDIPLISGAAPEPAKAPISQEIANMADGINSDKVNIQVGEGGGGGGGMQAAALVAALGQRNQGSDNAALIAALGQRNESHRGDDGFGFGGGGGGILGLLAILGLLRGRGGLGGGDDCGDGKERIVSDVVALQGINALQAAVPTTALQTQNALQLALAQLALGTAQGFERTGDRIQNSTYLLTKELCDVNQNVSAQGCQTREVVQETGREIMNLINGNRIAELEAQVARLHGSDHSRESEIRISQVVNQNQQQQQQQRMDDERFARLFATVTNIGNTVQRARSDQDIVNLGTMLGSGTQTPTNTQVGRQ